jgi:hypothetical protein
VIYEYAIDPALVKHWVLSRDVGLAPQFGLDQRRLVSDISDNWSGQVYGELLSHFNLDSSDPEFIDAEQFMTALMQLLRQGLDRGRQRTFQSWMEQVLDAHRDEPFHAILSRELIPGCEAVITPEVTRDFRNPRWYLPTIDVTSKTADALANQLAPLLRLARQIVLVDPYFKADDADYREVLKAMLQKAVSTRATGRAWPSVVLISGVADRDREASSRSREDQLLREAKHRCHMALERLGAFVPKGMSVSFQCVAAFADGDVVHNRYLLTDVGGAVLPYGTHPTGEHVYDDITPLFEGQYRARWKQYGKGEGLNVIGEPVVVQGLLG